MSHPYDRDANCQCERCVRERARRAAQSAAHTTYGHAAIKVSTFKRRQRAASRVASRAEQHARYIDCGPQNWDDR
jgi:hypothetical protein